MEEGCGYETKGEPIVNNTVKTINEVTVASLTEYFSRLDELVPAETVLYLYGGAAVIMYGATIRTTLDIDIAAPYSRINPARFAEWSAMAGIPVNPPVLNDGISVEFVQANRLSLPVPRNEANDSVAVFTGRNLTVLAASPADIIASKLVRYNEHDQQDAQYLIVAGRVSYAAICEAVSRLPPLFREDELVRENLENLKSDMEIWGIGA